MQVSFILAQIFGLVSGLFCAMSGRQKEHKQIMLYQIVDCLAAGISNLLLGATVGFVLGAVNLMRNLLSYFGKFNKVSLVIIIVSYVGINYGLSGIQNWADIVMPVNSVIYTVGVYFSNGRTTKKFLLLNLTLWIVYDIYTHNLGLLLFHLIASVSTAQSLIQTKLDSSRVV